jgi:hypothetical protein
MQALRLARNRQPALFRWLPGYLPEYDDSLVSGHTM